MTLSFISRLKSAHITLPTAPNQTIQLSCIVRTDLVRCHDTLGSRCCWFVTLTQDVSFYSLTCTGDENSDQDRHVLVWQTDTSLSCSVNVISIVGLVGMVTGLFQFDSKEIIQVTSNSLPSCVFLCLDITNFIFAGSSGPSAFLVFQELSLRKQT
jgi:hypothetical protein